MPFEIIHHQDGSWSVSMPAVNKQESRMSKLLWRIRAARVYQKRAGLTLRIAWDCAGALLEDYQQDGYSPDEAVAEDLTYWAA